MATISRIARPIQAEPPIGLLVAVVRQRLKRRLHRDLVRHRVTPPQMGLLFWLDDEDGLTASEVAQRTLMDLAVVTRVLDRLERAGLVARRRDPRDRRRVRLWLTPKGRALVPRLRPVYETANRELLRNLNAADERQLRRLLHRLIENLEEKA